MTRPESFLVGGTRYYRADMIDVSVGLYVREISGGVETEVFDEPRNADHVKREAYTKIIDALEAELAQSGTLFMDRAGLTKALGIVQRMRRRDCGS